MKSKPVLNILMLEDDSLDVELNKSQLLLLEEYQCNTLWVKDKKSFLKAIEEFHPDIILSDYNLPQYNGLEALIDLKSINPIIPFIFVTGAMKEETAAETIKNGAWDFVVKDRLFRLPLAIQSVLKIREEKVHAAQAEEQNRILSMSLEQSPVHVIIGNLSGHIEYVNAKFTHVTGYSAEEVIGHTMCTYITGPKNQHIWEKIWLSINQGYNWRGEFDNVKKDGTIYWEWVSISPLKNKSGAITHFITVKEDITRRKQIEQEILDAKEKAERSDRLKEAFLQNLSHEIRTPMNAIVGFSGLLTEEGTDPEMIPEYCRIIQNSSNQLLSIVTDILTIARIQTGQERVLTRPVFVNEVIDSLCERLRPKANEKRIPIYINKDSSNPMPVIITDETKLTQILYNLLQNAIKFTHKGRVEIGYNLKGSFIDFYVEDTGIGIPPEAIDLIFERFRQADPQISIDYGGTGLGLSISKSYASMLGGSINVVSQQGIGSTFNLKLPYHYPMADSNSQKSQSFD